MGSVADIMGNTMGGSFKLKWQTIYDLSFDETYALKNPYSDNRPLKISRDGEQACRSTHSIYRRRAKQPCDSMAEMASRAIAAHRWNPSLATSSATCSTRDT